MPVTDRHTHKYTELRLTVTAGPMDWRSENGDDVSLNWWNYAICIIVVIHIPVMLVIYLPVLYISLIESITFGIQSIVFYSSIYSSS